MVDKEYDEKMKRDGVFGRPSGDGDLKMKNLDEIVPDTRFLGLEFDGAMPAVPFGKPEKPAQTSVPIPVPETARQTRRVAAPIRMRRGEPVMGGGGPEQRRFSVERRQHGLAGVIIRQEPPGEIVQVGRGVALIHGVFNSAEDIQINLSRRLVTIGRRIDDLRWVGPRTAPEFTNNPEVAIVLYATLGTLQETFDFYWNWAASQQTLSHRWTELRSDSAHLRMWDRGMFEPNTIRWVALELNANLGKSPEVVRKEVKRTNRLLPGCEVLAALAEHPERACVMNGSVTRPNLYLAGIKVGVPDLNPWLHMPYAWFNASDAQLKLSADWHGYANSDSAVPGFFGST